MLLAFDLDFGDLMAQGVFDSPSVILFRLSDERQRSEQCVDLVFGLELLYPAGGDIVVAAIERL